MPNSDARTAQTCEVCGQRDTHVDTNSFLDLDLPPVDAHPGCLPSVHTDPRTWYREEVDQ